mmetsp:Transcript_7040/g.10634  ORF Transcript_7040/g.10634 Transcript_7040/m.10634 type:complete len:234 (+) Transcript_7040:550-1251(+)
MNISFPFSLKIRRRLWTTSAGPRWGYFNRRNVNCTEVNPNIEFIVGNINHSWGLGRQRCRQIKTSVSRCCTCYLLRHLYAFCAMNINLFLQIFQLDKRPNAFDKSYTILPFNVFSRNSKQRKFFQWCWNLCCNCIHRICVHNVPVEYLVPIHSFLVCPHRDQFFDAINEHLCLFFGKNSLILCIARFASNLMRKGPKTKVIFVTAFVAILKIIGIWNIKLSISGYNCFSLFSL